MKTGTLRVDQLVTAGGVIGAITGAATIVGWFVSADLGQALDVALPIGGAAYLAWSVIESAIDLAGPKRDRTGDLQMLGCVAALAAFTTAGELGLRFAVLGEINARRVLSWFGWLAIAVAVLIAAVFGPPAVAKWRAGAARKECPDCAEFVKQAANVCHWCGYRFADPPPRPDAE